MAEPEVDPRVPKAVGAVLFVAAVAGTVAVAYRIERAIERWTIEMDPLTKSRARYRDMRSRYRQRRLDVSDLGGLVFDLLDEIQRAKSSSRSAE
jgi:hypothetical protein